MVIADAESPGPLKKRPRLSLKVQKNNESKDVKVGKEETDQGGEKGKEYKYTSNLLESLDLC